MWPDRPDLMTLRAKCKFPPPAGKCHPTESAVMSHPQGPALAAATIGWRWEEMRISGRTSANAKESQALSVSAVSRAHPRNCSCGRTNAAGATLGRRI